MARQIKVPLPPEQMHKTGVFEFEISEGHPRRASHPGGRSVSYYGVLPSPSL